MIRKKYNQSISGRKKIIATFALAVLLAPCFVFADGGMIHFDPYSDRWDFSDETNQQAFINYEQGVEKMILSVGVGDPKEGKTMWIFPVPADPNKVAVDIVTKLPSLRGEEISEKAQSNLDDAKDWLQATQIYTIPFVFLRKSMLGASSMPQSSGFSNSLGDGSLKSALKPDVVVYEHLEKEGITSEIVTARTAQGFNEYFSKKGLQIESSSIPVLQNYIGKDYSFVVSWIEGSSPVSDDPASEISGIPIPGGYSKIKPDVNQKGVFVSFPTEKIYFPLMPTSVYGSKIVPAEIRVLGHVTPDVFADIKSFTKTEYYWDESVQFDKELKAFYNGQSQNIKYTKVDINAPSKFFTEDLWVKNSAPLATFYQSFIATQKWFDIIFVIVLCSGLTGLFTGWLLFREWRNWEGMKKFGLVGFANCMTILGLIAAILPTKTIKDSEDATSLVQTIREKGYYWKRRILLGVMIVDIPFLFISVFTLPLAVKEMLDSIMRPNYYYYSWHESLIAFGLSSMPVLVLITAWFLARVKTEDQELFQELRAKNYSSWTFQPKDKRKVWFIILYSIFFLIISWVVVKLLILSVGGQIIDSENSGIQF